LGKMNFNEYDCDIWHQSFTVIDETNIVKLSAT
jgi:hypothetical protein